jgi:multimeric flavodoxin WrbA
MKIAIINGSPRKDGATGKILTGLARQLESYGDVDISFFQLSDLRIEYCRGCCRCYKTGHCFIDDDCEMLSLAISEADGLIVGSPTYASSISGKLKTFIDRGHFVVEQLLTNTYTVGVVTYENADGGSVRKFLKKLFALSGGRNVGMMSVKVPFNENPLEKSRVREQAANLGRRLHRAIRNKSSSRLFDLIYHALVLGLVLKPFVKRKGKAYRGVIEHWERRGVISEAV